MIGDQDLILDVIVEGTEEEVEAAVRRRAARLGTCGNRAPGPLLPRSLLRRPPRLWGQLAGSESLLPWPLLPHPGSREGSAADTRESEPLLGDLGPSNLSKSLGLPKPARQALAAGR